MKFIFFVIAIKKFSHFQKDNRSVEYKTTGIKLVYNRELINCSDKNADGKSESKRNERLAILSIRPEQAA